MRARKDALSSLAGAVGLAASFSRVDGAVLLQNGVDVAGFGVEIRTTADVKRVSVAQDEYATKLVAADPRAYGTRHRSMMHYCQAHPTAVGIVVSRDGDIRAIATVKSELVMWEQSSSEPERSTSTCFRFMQESALRRHRLESERLLKSALRGRRTAVSKPSLRQIVNALTDGAITLRH